MENNKKTSSNTTVLIVVLLISLAIIAIVFPRTFNSAGETNDFLNLKEIETQVLSSKDGSSHTITAYFSLEVDPKDTKNVDTDEIHEVVTELVAELDYDLITAQGSVDYIKSEIKSGLRNYDEGYIQNIYIHDLSSGSYRIIASKENASRRSDGVSVNDILKGLGNK